MEYKDRPIPIQIKIDVLVRCFDEPAEYYKNMSDKQILGKYYEKLPQMLQMTKEKYNYK